MLSCVEHERSFITSGPEGTPFPAMPDIKLTAEGVLQLLQKLKRNKANLPHMLLVRFLKELATEVSLFLTTIFQQSLDTGTVPKDCETPT